MAESYANLTHTYEDGTTVTFTTDTERRMCVLDAAGIGACPDIVCQWCKHMKIKPKAGFCAKYSDKPDDAYFYSAPCEKFEDNGSGKSFSCDVLAEDLPKDPQIRESLIAQLRKDFGHAVAVVGDQIFHLGRMGVYAANIYPREFEDDDEYPEKVLPGNLGIHALDEICNASSALREGWNYCGRKLLQVVTKRGNLEEFKLMPFICYAPSQIIQRKNDVVLGKQIGSRVHWALLTPEDYGVTAKYLGAEPQK